MAQAALPLPQGSLRAPPSPAKSEAPPRRITDDQDWRSKVAIAVGIGGMLACLAVYAGL